MARLDRVTRCLLAQEMNAQRLLSYPNVVGIGTGFREQRERRRDEVVVQAFVQRKYSLDELPDWALLPGAIPGPEGRDVRLDVIDVGYVYAAQDTTRYRPVPGGCSIGHQSVVDASTLGGWACDRTDDTIVLLSCNHCIANLNVASVPGGIVQQGRLDGGAAPADLIGQLKRFIPINIGIPPPGVTAVDAAIGTITAGRTDNILQIGPAVYELGTPTLGMAVQKRGRTTRFTNNGTITSVGVQVTVNYAGGTTQGLIGNAFRVTSTDGNAFANRGDSGSLIFDQTAGVLGGTFPVVGMFFAVSGGGVTTFHNDINAVFGQLNLSTVCDCAVRALIEAIFGAGERSAGSADRMMGAAGGAGRGTRRLVDRKDAQLRRFRDQIMAQTPFGKVVASFVASEAAELSRAIMEDDEIFGLAVRTFEPWVRKGDNFEVLEAEVDAETVANFGRLAERVARFSPRLREQMKVFRASVEAVRGMKVRELLSAARPPEVRPVPAKKGASKRKSRR
jgi:hypothetical protein